ncbi:MAG: hypothetical protein U0K53_02330 [Paludibacteraceae bacterium]|nr:hypothetical protein [Paludibacteraceae bacterium]
MANQTFSIRLSEEYINIFNKLHEQANEANPISKSAFFEKVLDFFANPKVKEVEVIRDSDETTALVQWLKNQNTEQTENIQMLTERLQEIEGKHRETIEQTTCLQSDYDANVTKLKEQVDCLRQELNKANERTVLDMMKPFPATILNMTAARLSQKHKRNIAPVDVLTDMFLRYTIERWNKWFYDWVLTDDEIVKEAQRINPTITSIKQLKNFVIK